MFKKKKSEITVLSLALAGSLVLSACNVAETDVSANSAPIDPQNCEIEEGNLRVYLNPWGATLTDEFTADTGIDVDLADLGGGEILARVAAEANNPQWDVVVLDGHGSLEGLRQSGQLLESPPVQNVSNLNSEGQSLLPENDAWIPISKHAAAIIAYNVDAVNDENVPKTWEDLLSPKLAPVGIADPAIAAPAYPVVSWFFEDRGDAEAKEYFDTLKKNGLNTYEKNGPVGNAVATGAVKTAMMQEQHLFEMIDDGEPIDFVWPEEGAPAAVRAAAISADTPRPCAAAALIDWMLDPENMTYLMEEGGDDGIITPFVEGTDTSSLPASRPEDAKLNITDAEYAADHEAEIKDWFANLQLQ